MVPAGGHDFSPADGVSPHECVARGGLGEGDDSAPGGGLGEAVAVTLGDDDVGVVQEPVDGRGGEGLGP
jgi:hypothetical protein